MATDGPEPKSFALSREVHAYLVAHGSEPDEHQRWISDRTRELGDVARMQLAPEQASLLTLLTHLVGARLAVEVGTFTGTSALAIARGLQPGGRLVCCDVSEEWTAIATRAWERAGVADRIDLVLGPATDTLARLDEHTPIDLAFIDADKAGYVDYYEAIVPRLRPGGLLVADNVLWFGAVADPAVTDDATEAIRRFNDHVHADPRTESLIIPVGDGLLLARRR